MHSPAPIPFFPIQCVCALSEISEIKNNESRQISGRNVEGISDCWHDLKLATATRISQNSKEHIIIARASFKFTHNNSIFYSFDQLFL